MNPIPDQPNDVELEECPMCGEIKAINVSTADRIGILCLKCGYNAGRYLQRASIEKFDELDREIQSIEEKIQSKPKIRKGKK